MLEIYIFPSPVWSCWKKQTFSTENISGHGRQLVVVTLSLVVGKSEAHSSAAQPSSYNPMKVTTALYRAS